MKSAKNASQAVEEWSAEGLCAALKKAGADGWNVVAFDECDSTNARAKELALRGAAGKTLLAASRQTAGRGRLGRSFDSPEGGVYFSLLMPVGALRETTLLTCAAAVAASGAIRNLTGKQVGIKWVNDLFWQGKKVCGILCESTGIESKYVIVGIGLNLRPRKFPPDLETIAGSLGEEALSRSDLIASIVASLESLLASPAPSWMETYRSLSLTVGKTVEFSRDGQTFVGVATSIASDGSLEVLTPSGSRFLLRTGEARIL